MNQPPLRPIPPPPPLVVDTDSPSHPPVSRIRWWIFFVLIGFYPLAMGLIGGNRAATRGPALSHTAHGLLIVCGLGLLVFGALFTLAWLAPRPTLDDLRLRWRGGFWIIPLAFTYSIGIRLALAFAGILAATFLLLTRITTPQALENFIFKNRPNVETLIDVSALSNNPAYFWLSLTLVSFVVAGLREELWRAAFLAGARALWPAAFGSRGGQLAAAALGAVVFGLGHLPQGPLAVCMTGLLGFVLGAIMILHRSIWPAVIAHGAFDAVSMALIPLATDLMHKVQPS